MVKNFALVYGVICAASFHFASCQFDDYNINDLDEYQIYEGGYDAIEDASIDKTYFDPYAGEYDDPYSDSVFDDMLEVKDCQIAADGTATFNGVHKSPVMWYKLLAETAALMLSDNVIHPCRHAAVRHTDQGGGQGCSKLTGRYGRRIQGLDL